MSIVEAHDGAIHNIVSADAPLERIASTLGFTEGPLWMGDHLLFSDLAYNRICRWRDTPAGVELTTFRYPSGWDLDDTRAVVHKGANGLTLDGQRRLIACEHGRRRVSRTEADGSVIVLADHYQGKRLNSPNDVIVRSDGCVFFSDPPYGLPNQGDGRELEVNGFYRVDTDGAVVLLVGDFDRPNGLAFAPDERTIYLADTRRRHLRAFDVTLEGDLTNGRLFADMAHEEPGGPDGVKVDAEGNVYAAGAAGIWIFTPEGRPLGIIRTPARPTNLAFGGPDRKTLFVTAQDSVFRMALDVAGQPVPMGMRR